MFLFAFPHTKKLEFYPTVLQSQIFPLRMEIQILKAIGRNLTGHGSTKAIMSTPASIHFVVLRTLTEFHYGTTSSGSSSMS